MLGPGSVEGCGHPRLRAQLDRPLHEHAQAHRRRHPAGRVDPPGARGDASLECVHPTERGATRVNGPSPLIWAAASVPNPIAVMSVSTSARYATPTRNPRCFVSRRNVLPSASTAALLAAYAPMSGSCTPAAADATSSTYPPGCATSGPAARTVWYVPSRFTSTVRVMTSGSPPSRGSCAATPALATTTSSPPRSSARASTARCTASPSRTSHTRHGAPPHIVATCSSSSRSSPSSATRAPRAYRRRARDAPIPRAAPVTRTRRPSRRSSSACLVPVRAIALPPPLGYPTVRKR